MGPRALYSIRRFSYTGTEDGTMEPFHIQYVMDHVEVFDRSGRFCFSADTVAEAMEELRESQLAA